MNSIVGLPGNRKSLKRSKKENHIPLEEVDLEAISKDNIFLSNHTLQINVFDTSMVKQLHHSGDLIADFNKKDNQYIESHWNLRTSTGRITTLKQKDPDALNISEIIRQMVSKSQITHLDLKPKVPINYPLEVYKLSQLVHDINTQKISVDFAASTVYHGSIQNNCVFGNSSDILYIIKTILWSNPKSKLYEVDSSKTAFKLYSFCLDVLNAKGKCASNPSSLKLKLGQFVEVYDNVVSFGNIPLQNVGSAINLTDAINKRDLEFTQQIFQQDIDDLRNRIQKVYDELKRLHQRIDVLESS
jgi:hypothetical protein